jgi:hypothetical protein
MYAKRLNTVAKDNAITQGKLFIDNLW